MRRATKARIQALCGCRETKKFIGIGGGDFKRERVRRGQNTFLVASGVQCGREQARSHI
ncbi:hypothetical protein FX984_00804 [Pseudomonas marginalis]|nr:hypothetical protein FX984_00804 [Pseudomonas marginalis]